MENFKSNLLIGKITLIIGCITLGFFPLVILIGAKLHDIGTSIYLIYFLPGFLAVLLIASGVLFIISLIINIRESKKIKAASKGLKFTLISIALFFFVMVQ